VVGVGVTPQTAWLAESRLPLRDGVLCDCTCATPAPGVVAAGDVARWPNLLFKEEMRVEHWDNAVSQGKAAARRLLHGPGVGPHAPVPYFWSDQYDKKLQFVGRVNAPPAGAEMVAGTLTGDRFLAVYGREERITGALGLGMPRAITQARSLIERRTPLQEATALLAQSAPLVAG
jgi:NADPH-dependent 2,4-dienoyl-CoA reductase/sulfur reductase-like enzyme